MSNFSFRSFLLLMIFGCVLSSCREIVTYVPDRDDCVFVQDDSTQDGWIDEEERQIMDDCFSERITDVNELKNNLIGTWELIGHGEGWFPNISQPCSRIVVAEDLLTLDFEGYFTDTFTVHNWTITMGDSGLPNLEISPFLPEVWLNIFCENYMYGDATPVDGNMYLYTKLVED